MNVLPAQVVTPRGLPRLRLLRLLLLALCLGAAAGTVGAQVQRDPPSAEDLPEPVRQALQAQGLPQEALSFVVQRREGGPPRVSWRAGEPGVPGSTVKALTTLVALDHLGPAHRWTTDFLAAAPAQDGVLRGLQVRGEGDPDFTAERLQSALRELRAQGVHTLQGEVVLDRRAFDPARPDLDAPAFDESPDAYYNVVPDALLLNGNLLFLQLSSDRQRVRAAVVTPAVAGLRVDASGLQLHDGPCAEWERGWQAPIGEAGADGVVLRLRGRFPRDCSARAASSALERNAYWQVVMAGLWQELGGRWQARVVDGPVAADARVLVSRRSDALADVVRRVNKASDNAMARLLYLTLGAQWLAGAPGNTAAAAQAAVHDWLQRHGVPADGIVLDNGSGLSRSERMSAMQLAAVLRAGVQGDWAPEFESSLPIAAVDGTVRRRLRDTPAAGRARLKTGTLRDMNGVAGIVRDLARQEWIVVAWVNHPQAGRARPVIDALVNWVAGHPLRPAEAR